LGPCVIDNSHLGYPNSFIYAKTFAADLFPLCTPLNNPEHLANARPAAQLSGILSRQNHVEKYNICGPESQI